MRKLVRRVKIEGILPHGPSRPPPSYEKVIDRVSRDDDLNEATTAWYSLARAEWSELTGEVDKCEPARFKWAPAVPDNAHPLIGTTIVSNAWRACARRAQDILRVFSRPSASSARVIRRGQDLPSGCGPGTARTRKMAA